jgi:hypothetical protein
MTIFCNNKYANVLFQKYPNSLVCYWLYFKSWLIETSEIVTMAKG